MNNYLIPKDKLEIHNGEVMISSRVFAEFFEKQHKHVLADVRRAQEMIEMTGLNLDPLSYFIKSEYMGNNGELRPEYLMTRKGFECVAMSYTGQKAFDFKVKFIETFHYYEKIAMEKQLQDTKILKVITNNIDFSKSLTQIFGKYGLSANKINDFLLSKGYLYTKKHPQGFCNNKFPTDKMPKDCYTEVERYYGPTIKNGIEIRPEHTEYECRWKASGMQFIFNLLFEEKILKLDEDYNIVLNK